jgi:lon-related putative ATP-dependent protease
MSDTPAANHAVAIEQLKRRCRAEELDFKSTAELAEAVPEPVTSDGNLLQLRALAALELGVQMASPGHNVYVMGQPGSGRHAAVRVFLERFAARRPPPDDWCYLNRFEDAQRPRAVRLAAGRGTQLKVDMRELVRDLRTALPQALESETHRKRRAEIDHEFERQARQSIEAVRQEAEQSQLMLIQGPDGFAVAPVKNGEIFPREAFEKLPDSERARLRTRMEAVSEKLRTHLESVPRWARDQQHRLRELDREAVAGVVRVHIAELRSKYGDCPEVLDHIGKVEADLIENATSSIRADQVTISIPGLEQAELQANMSRYDVNVLIDGRAFAGAPVIYESNPTYQNLIGQVENVAQFGTLMTDFTHVRPGVLHRANGGFLLLDAERLLSQPFSWDALKHALFERCVRIESLGAHLSLISTVSLEPDRIPLSVRVVLIGTRRTYDLLCEFDPEFPELFKIAADFDDVIDRNEENVRRYARLIASTVRREGLKAFEAAAVARLIEHGSRLAGDSRKLSMHIRSLEDAMREAHQIAATTGEAMVQPAHVESALENQRHRLGRSHTEVLDAIRDHTLLVNCEGESVGQVNGLSVVRIGSLHFGQPSRITANVRIGEGDVIDIEREVKLGGAIHSKGVLILAALIGSRFGIRQPLSLHASLVFEQSYGGVEGDSASLAETCALLSAIADVPLRQSLGVTGSINQHGVVQAIGSVNEKIEGFFEACRISGLTGTQGVIIPADNLPHLMLQDEVIAAVERGRFQIYSVRTLDEAVELLSGRSSGTRDARGEYPQGTFNASVEKRLRQFASARQEFTRDALQTGRSVSERE